ncbi:MAG: DUF4197 domain-containing protein [Gammaproteobacteria bacterium]|nr:DUF4197 domain-containing protein [Gammaproteobacteria bacterium]
MTQSRIFLAIALLASIFVFSVGAQAGWQDFLKEQLDTLSGDDKGSDQLASVLSNDEVIAGLKQALEKGADYAVQSLGKADGFLGNNAVRIPMPDKLQTVEKTLRQLGQDKYADEFVTTMNRAAEQAVPLTLDILKKGVANMSFDDARSILKGPDDAATSYLRKVGGEEMTLKISPIVADMTARTGVTSQYKQLFDKLGFLNSVMDPDDYDIDKYVTAKTVDGLFHMISVEEKNIRENPLERTTDLLKKVFAN